MGSGKTLIGCITVLSWAVSQPGNYLIARQYYPELKTTTMQTFFEICPPELIIERRVADNLVIIQGVNGPATILFRPLEDWDKLRSLNLSGFYIDEGNQVSEEAFMMLQGRLRHQKGLRKGIITMNPAGHDWVYRWFFKKDHITSQSVKDLFYLIKAPSTENTHLPEGYVQNMLDTWSPDRIEREINASFDAFEGAIYSEFRRDLHVIKPFVIPKEWPKIIGIDHGLRNPAAWVWGAVDNDGNLIVYREFYKKEWLIKEICFDGKNGELSAYHRMGKDEKVEAAYIDPATRARRGATGRSDYDHYRDHLPPSIALVPANNSVTAGIDLMKWYLKPQVVSNSDPRPQPKLFIFDTCVNLIEEMINYKYTELNPSREGKQTAKEAPVKVNDHALDALRYMVMGLPDPRKVAPDPYKTRAYTSIEGRLYRDLQGIKGKTGKDKDPFKGGL